MADLIAYFSRADENYVNGALRFLERGNTEVAACFIKKVTGGELFKIKPVSAYAKDYNTCIAEAKADLKRKARPELKRFLPSVQQYDSIYLGFPNYWGTMPMAVFTFLESCDFAGKQIFPFCTHEGSGMGHCEADIRKACPKSIIGPGLAIHGAEVENAFEEISSWVGKNHR